ncbi:hypothetical protein [Amycolatopsis pittospori]|uniref:hypothetical protein n=1 Tax=Amycolatopsis pittospori TaxID=2749434 RepID=UPI0015F081D4|nr:hypothetical protein [Amycolatopsis pittospori]
MSQRFEEPATASGLGARELRDRLVIGALRRMAGLADVAPYLRGPSRAVAARLTSEVLSRCLDVLEPGGHLSDGEQALRPRPGEPAAVRAVMARVLGRFAWEQLSGVIGPFDAPSSAVCRAAEVLFDSLVELARPSPQ